MIKGANMNNKSIEKHNKFIHFVEKWIIIGIILFLIVQLTAVGIVDIFIPKENRLSENQYEDYNKDYIGHWYDGTFFINMTVKENFESQEKYNEMIDEYHNDTLSKICLVSGTICSISGIALLIIAAFKEKKKKLLEGNTPIIIVIAGLLLLLFKIIEEIDLFIDTRYYKKYSIGFLNTTRYYPQIYSIFIIPILLICLGLIYRQKQRKDLNLSLNRNEKIIKIICWLIAVVGFSFITFRLGIRIYELIMILLNKDMNIRISFYYFIFDLPKEFAITNTSYLKLVILRFIKDLPIYISSTISLILFIKILLSSTKNKIVSKENNRRYKIIFILLFISSLIFNILGLIEVNILNNEFLYQYKEAKYTIAVRSLTEPMLYGFFIYIFKHYVELGYLTNKSK